MANVFVNEEKFLGLDAVRLSAGGYEALLVPEVGANLVSLEHIEKNVSILRTPGGDITAQQFKARPQVYGIPVLFWPNRIKNGTCVINGRSYNLPVNPAANNNHLHGFLHTRPWTVTRMEVCGDVAVAEATFVCTEETDFYDSLPHAFTFVLTYELSANGLMQKIKITNDGDEKMPVGLGFHTSMNAPFIKGGNPSDYLINLSVAQKWEVEQMIPLPGVPVSLTPEDEKFLTTGVKPVGQVLDNLHFTSKAADMAGHMVNGAVITDSSNGLQVVYEWGPKFRHTVIWNEQGDKGYVCPEPQTWAINAPNMGLPDEVTGLCMINPGEIWTEYTKISLHC